MKRHYLIGIVCAVLVCGCSSNGGGKDGGGPDFFPVSEAGYPDFGALWDCPTPGQSCEAHNACVMSATCGADKKCHPIKVMNCDDGLDCTEDTCKAGGECVNTSIAGTCALPVKYEKDGKTVTETRCFKHGDKNPYDSCQVCNASKDGGSPNTWGLANGGECDDGNPCTKNDYCQSGVCKGQDYSKDCADNYSCTTDSCDGKGGCGSDHPLRSDWCLIKDTGAADSVCYKDQQTDASGCNICDVSKNQHAWTSLGVHCVISSKCYKPGDTDSTGCGVCDPTKSTTAWTPVAGLCKIGTVCYKAGALHPQGCADCEPTVSATAWTVVGDNCLVNNTCYKNGAKDSTGCQVCDPAKSKTAWSTVTNMCKIGSSCYTSGAKHSQGCAICDPATSATAWTVNTDNCLISNVCYIPGTKDSIGCSDCEPAKDKYNWTALPNLCKISGKCYTANSKDPTGCAICDPATSSTAWTVPGANCLIVDKCYTPGQTSTNGCGSCDPTKSKSAWTPVAGKCAIGGNCYSNGDKDATGCLTCNVAQNPNGWTPVAGVSSQGESFDTGKNPPTGWTLVNDDPAGKVGWVVSNRRALSGSYSLYYGDPATGNYDNGDSNSGVATMPAIALTAGKKAGLSFWLYMDTESGSFDTLVVNVNGKAVWSKDYTNVTMKQWQEIDVDLSSYAGQSVVIDFSFDTGDSISNSTEGTFIDSVTVYHNC
jgi:hypothetical protein